MGLLVLIGLSSLAQTTITGYIREASNHPVAQANILLVNADSTAIITFATSNKDGYYELTCNQVGTFLVKCTCLGYQTVYHRINFPSQEKRGAPVDFVLQKQVYALDEVAINANLPVLVKEDTIIIDPKHFQDGTERAVDELLAKLPGIAVDEEGAIKVNGKSVETVMINGDNLFDEKYKLLTQNLDAETIDKVEVLRNFSQNPVLKSFKRTEQTALNLTLKETYKTGVWGALTAGYGLEENHTLKGTPVVLLNKIKLYSFINSNTIGHNPVTFNYYELSIDGLLNGHTLPGDNQKNRYISMGSIASPDLQEERYTENRTRYISTSYITQLAKNVKTKGLVIYGEDVTKQNDILSQRFLLPQDTLQRTEQNEWENRSSQWHMRSQTTYSPREKVFATYWVNFQHNNLQSEIQTRSSSHPYQTQKDKKPFELDQAIKVTSRLSKNTLLNLSARYLLHDKEQNFLSSSSPLLDSSNNELALREQRISNNLNLIGLTGEILLELNKTLFRFRATHTCNQSVFSSHGYNTTAGDTTMGAPFINNRDYRLSQTSIAVNMHANLSESFSIFGNLSANYLNRRDKFNAPVHDNSTFFDIYLTPKLGIRWQTNPYSFLLQYSEGKNPTAVSEVFRAPIITSYRSQLLGLHNTKLTKERLLLCNFSYGGWAKNFLLHASLLKIWHSRYIGSRELVDAHTEQTQLVPLNGSESTNGNLSLDRFLELLSTNIKMSVSYFRHQSKLQLNNAPTTMGTLESIKLSMSGRTVFSIPINFHVGAAYIQNTSNFLTQQSTHREVVFTDIVAKLEKNLQLKINNDLYLPSTQFASAEPTLFTDIYLSYRPKKKRYRLSLQGSNVFGHKNYYQNSITSYLHAYHAYKLRPRYFLASVSIHF